MSAAQSSGADMSCEPEPVVGVSALTAGASAPEPAVASIVASFVASSAPSPPSLGPSGTAKRTSGNEHATAATHATITTEPTLGSETQCSDTRHSESVRSVTMSPHAIHPARTENGQLQTPRF